MSLFSFKGVKRDAKTACNSVLKTLGTRVTFKLRKLPDNTYRAKVNAGKLESVGYPADLYEAHHFLQHEIWRLGA